MQLQSKERRGFETTGINMGRGEAGGGFSRPELTKPGLGGCWKIERSIANPISLVFTSAVVGEGETASGGVMKGTACISIEALDTQLT